MRKKLVKSFHAAVLLFLIHVFSHRPRVSFLPSLDFQIERLNESLESHVFTFLLLHCNSLICFLCSAEIPSFFSHICSSRVWNAALSVFFFFFLLPQTRHYLCCGGIFVCLRFLHVMLVACLLSLYSAHSCAATSQRFGLQGLRSWEVLNWAMLAGANFTGARPTVVR